MTVTKERTCFACGVLDGHSPRCPFNPSNIPSGRDFAFGCGHRECFDSDGHSDGCMHEGEDW